MERWCPTCISRPLRSAFLPLSTTYGLLSTPSWSASRRCPCLASPSRHGFMASFPLSLGAQSRHAIANTARGYVTEQVTEQGPPSLGIQLYTTQAKTKDLVAYVTRPILSYSATYTILLSHRPSTWQHRQRCIGAVLLIQPAHRACCRAPAPIKISPARYTSLPLERNVI